jgi:hypothetical protein
MIILPKLKHLKSSEDFVPAVSFASSTSGWMNRELFLVWTIDILAQISTYRETELPLELQDKWIVLIVDGHTSRADFESNLLFFSARVWIIILPGHTTHVLQPIDVGLTSPIKSHFLSKLADLTEGDVILDETGHDTRIPSVLKKLTAERLRWILVAAFLHGVQSGCTWINIKAAWRKSGLCPVCPNEPLTSPFVIPQVASELGQQCRNRGLDPSEVHGVAQINNGVLSNEEGLRALIDFQHHRPATPEDVVLTPERLDELVTRHAAGPRKENVALSDIYAMTVRDDGLLCVRRIL